MCYICLSLNHDNKEECDKYKRCIKCLKYGHLAKNCEEIFIRLHFIGDVRDEGYLEGGDFFVAREDLSMLGIGLITDMNEWCKIFNEK